MHVWHKKFGDRVGRVDSPDAKRMPDHSRQGARMDAHMVAADA